VCSVSGVLILNPKNFDKVERKLADILKRAEDRGRDSFGIVVIQKDGTVKVRKSVGKPSEKEELLYGILDEDSRVVIANNRAEPTTEYVRQKTEEDIQPFIGDRYIVTHNGIIANDLELEKKYELKRKTKIDSAILPSLLDKTWDGNIGTLKGILEQIRGSFALVIGDKRNHDRIFLAQNFKPLYMAYDYSLESIFFTSLDEYFDVKPFDLVNVTKLEPYSVVMVSSNKQITTLPIIEKRKT
jgi:7-cyano-7-deazaguanine synthase